jgi:dipeptidyl aminopeptidase/acylaminoacyl peptidase
VDFADRESVASSVDEGVRMLIERGIVDPGRVGITGLSDGAGTVQFELARGARFAAAAMSNCCLEAASMPLVGPSALRHFVDEGYPGLTSDGTPFWRRISIVQNARPNMPPLLLQVSDDEYLTAVNSFSALREVGASVEMYVYPDEHHIKWQPAHRLAIYQRSLEWFDRWLMPGQIRVRSR